MKKRILVSACLLGEPCRYDAKSKPCESVKALKAHFELVRVCPEQLGGLPTPRPAAEINGDRVLRADGTCVTEFFVTGAIKALETAKKCGCEIAVLKAKSPSCGKGRIYDGTFSATLTDGNGVSAAMLMENGITVLTEDETDKLFCTE